MALRGVFWIVEDELLAYPFHEGCNIGVAKSGKTFNHRALWNAVMGNKGKRYDYYPRGRVEIDNRGNAIVFINPHINKERWIPKIRDTFAIEEEEVIIKEDHSTHYECHLDKVNKDRLDQAQAR